MAAPRSATVATKSSNCGDRVIAGQRRWFVRFLLQSKEDPELLVPTSDAWVTRGRKARMLDRMGADLHETLRALEDALR